MDAVYWCRAVWKPSYCFQYDSLSASCSWRKWASMYLQSRAFPASLPLSIGGSVINTSVTLSALCRGSVPLRETTRTTTTNNNKLDRYEVWTRCPYLPTYPRPAFPTLSPDHLQLSRRFIAVTVSILLVVRSRHESPLPFHVILRRQDIWSNYSLGKKRNTCCD